MSEDVKKQVVNEIKASPMFSFQVDESTDVSSCAQLLVFVRYIRSSDIKDEFLFCSELDTTTTSADIMKKIKTFLKQLDYNGKMFVKFAPMKLLLCFVKKVSCRLCKKSKETCSRNKGYTLFYS